MIKRILLVVSIVLIGSVQLALADCELWSVNTFQYPLGEKVKFNLIPELRFKNNASDLYYILNYIGPTFSLNKNFDLNLFYAPKSTKNGGGWTNSSIGYLDLAYKNENLSNRGRFEYDLNAELLKYRNQVQIKKAGWQASEEIFYNLRSGYFDETRTLAGYVFKPFGRFELAVGYLLRGQKKKPNDDWIWTNVINMGTKFLF
jgi:hypothetical protein